MPLTIHPLSTTSSSNLIQLFLKYGVDRHKLPMAALTLGLSLASSPIRLLERRSLNRKLRSIQIHQPPVFIIGHWRSGTTYLHNLMSQDPNFGSVSLLQSIAPEIYAAERPLMRILLEKSLPKTRPQDNVAFSQDAPQEEDFPLAGISNHSFYHCLYFPKRLREIFDQGTCLENLNLEEKQAWKADYLKIIKRAYLDTGRKQLLLKNPPNTARISELISMFPNAKFIHIYRNPYDVFFSTRNLYRKTSKFAFNHFEDQQLEDDIFALYRYLMESFFVHRDLVPQGNLVEIRYEDLVDRPFDEVARLYRQLELPGFDQAAPIFQNYIEQQASYRPNHYTATPEMIERIYDNWKFTINRWGYAKPGVKVLA